jgi:glycosyltransferase involved in cell wall biosynthesis
MKLLCFIDSLGAGGAQRQLVTLAIEFSKRGYEVEFLLYEHNDFYLSTLQDNNIKVNYIIEENFIKRIFKVRRFIRKGNYDIVLSFLVRATFMAELASLPYRRWKLFVGERSSDPRIVNLWKTRIIRWLHLFADKVISNSNTNVELVRQACPLLPKSKFSVIYNAVDINKFVCNLDYEFKKNDKIRIVVPASYRYLKNLSGLIDALQLIDAELRKKLLIDWYGHNLLDDSKSHDQEKINQYGLQDTIILHDAINNIEDEMTNADFIGLFSLIEGFPNAVCEGMLLGKPILCSSVSDIPMIIEDGVNGLVCDPKNPRSIADALINALNFSAQDMREMGARNRKKAIALFAKDVNVNNYINVFNEK